MKRTLNNAVKAILVAALVLTTALGTTGCKTTNPNTGEQTVDMVKVQKAASLLKTTVASSLVLVLDKNPDKAADIKKYLGLTVVVVDELIANENYTPGKLQDAILSISGKIPAEGQVAMIAVIGLYDIYYADYVRGVAGKNQVAVTFLTALRDGIQLGTNGDTGRTD